jgi:hypothetical protein
LVIAWLCAWCRSWRARVHSVSNDCLAVPIAWWACVTAVVAELSVLAASAVAEVRNFASIEVSPAFNLPASPVKAAAPSV